MNGFSKVECVVSLVALNSLLAFAPVAHAASQKPLPSYRNLFNGASLQSNTNSGLGIKIVDVKVSRAADPRDL